MPMHTETNNSLVDDLVERVEGMIENPKTATPKNLQNLLNDLKELKGDQEGEFEEEEGNESEDRKDKPGFVIAIGLRKPKTKEEKK